MKNGQKTPKKLEFRLKNKENRQKAGLKPCFGRWSGQIGTNRLFWVVGRDVGFRSPNRDCPGENGTVGKYALHAPLNENCTSCSNFSLEIAKFTTPVDLKLSFGLVISQKLAWLHEIAKINTPNSGSKQKKRKKGRRAWKIGCVGIANHSQGALPNFQRMGSDDRKTPTIRTGNIARQTREGKWSGKLSFFFEESNLECWVKRKVKVAEN